MVIACIDFYNPEVQNLIQSDLPVITIDHVFDNRSAVLSDNVNGMEELVEYICSMGHERVAYIHGADSSVSPEPHQQFLPDDGKAGGQCAGCLRL